jgi:hypothetical protein
MNRLTNMVRSVSIPGEGPAVGMERSGTAVLPLSRDGRSRRGRKAPPFHSIPEFSSIFKVHR